MILPPISRWKTTSFFQGSSEGKGNDDAGTRFGAGTRGARAIPHGLRRPGDVRPSWRHGVQSPVSPALRCPQQVTTIHPHPHHPQPHDIPLDLIVTKTKIATKIVTKTGLLAERTP